MFLKVLIAEDEPWIRRGIIKSINWEGSGFQLAGEASNGEQAIQLALELHPDIVLVDIQMPRCNGLELMQRLIREGDAPKFIIISGYSDFEYARTAIALGALAYLLKPIKKKELQEALVKASDTIKLQRELKENLEATSHQLQASIPIVKEGIMMDLLAGGKNTRLKHVASFSPYYAVLAVGMDDYLSLRSDPEMLERNRKMLLRQTEMLLGAYKEGIVFERDENCFAVVIGLETMRSSKRLSLAQSIVQTMSKHAISVTVGVGGIHRDVANIKRSFDEAICAYQEKLIAGGGTILVPPPVHASVSVIPEEQLQALRMAIEITDLREIRFLVQVLFNMMTGMRDFGFESVKRWVTRLQAMGDDIAARHGVHPSHRIDESELLYIEGMNRLMQMLQDSFIGLSQQISASKEVVGKKAAETAVDFILQHYAEEITLEKLARHVQLSPNYLSEMFKREVGINFIDYLAGVRMEKAKELLSQHRGMSIGKAAELVGYNNPRYFSSLFFKRTGLKPTEYKQQALHRQSWCLGKEDEDPS